MSWSDLSHAHGLPRKHRGNLLKAFVILIFLPSYKGTWWHVQNNCGIIRAVYLSLVRLITSWKLPNSKVALCLEVPKGEIDMVSQIHGSPLVLVGGHEIELKPLVGRFELLLLL